MGTTKTLADYLSGIEFDDLPEKVRRRALLGVLDILGVTVGGLGIPSYSDKFIALSRAVGGGTPEATLIGGDKVCLSMAAFGNAYLAHALDYPDHATNKSLLVHSLMGGIVVPSALAAIEFRGGSGKDFLAAVVAGYECAGRVLRAIDISMDMEPHIIGFSTSVMGAAAAAARGLDLTKDQTLSTLGMAGLQAPVPAGYKFLFDVGLTPRKDIKQGWGWMAHAGVFAAQSTLMGHEMLQENNILDGDRSFGRMMGYDIYHEEAVTRGLGEDFTLLGEDRDTSGYHAELQTKRFPGCSITHSAITGARQIIHENGLGLGDIARIDVTTNRRSGIGEDDQTPESVQDMQFSIPYQVGAGVSGYPRGPVWYTDARETALSVAKKTFVNFDDDCNDYFRKTRLQFNKVAITTQGGDVLRAEIYGEKMLFDEGDILEKYHECTAQVLGADGAARLHDAVFGLEQARDTSALTTALAPPARKSAA